MADSVTFTALPDPGYAVDQWQTNNVAAQSGGTSFTLVNVTAHTAVQVTFQGCAGWRLTPSRQVRCLRMAEP